MDINDTYIWLGMDYHDGIKHELMHNHDPEGESIEYSFDFKMESTKASRIDFQIYDEVLLYLNKYRNESW